MDWIDWIEFIAKDLNYSWKFNYLPLLLKPDWHCSVFLQTTEPWEAEKHDVVLDEEEDDSLWEKKVKVKKEKTLKIINEEVYRINRYGKAFKKHIKIKT